MAIEGHTVSRPHLPSLSYEDQKYELCQSTDLLEGWFGSRPQYFRPPYLDANDDTLRAAWDCGLTAALSAGVGVHAGLISYSDDTHQQVDPGDILVVHFDPTFPGDFIIALQAVKAAGLTPALLEDYIAS